MRFGDGGHAAGGIEELALRRPYEGFVDDRRAVELHAVRDDEAGLWIRDRRRHLARKFVWFPEINVTDNLVGGRLSLRGNHGFGGGLRVFGSVMTDLYQRLSNLNSTQNATSVCYDGGPCRQTFRLNQYASQNHFVPRAEVALGAAVDIVENWSIGLFFKFDGLWNMTRPDVPRFNGFGPLGSATQANKSQLGLSGDDQIQVYSWGLVFAGRF